MVIVVVIPIENVGCTGVGCGGLWCFFAVVDDGSCSDNMILIVFVVVMVKFVDDGGWSFSSWVSKMAVIDSCSGGYWYRLIVLVIMYGNDGGRR